MTQILAFDVFLACAFSCPVNCEVGGSEEVRIQMLGLSDAHIH